MKKFIKITFLTVLLFIPVFTTNAISQSQIDAEVQIVCTDGAGNWFSGSGTIIDPKGIILTNRHVVEGAYQDTCFIGFIESVSQEPNFGTEGDYNLAEVKYKNSSDDMDVAILYLDNQTNDIYPYVDIWSSNSDTLQFGDKIEAIGFPNIGGSTITYTSGDFSGFGSESDGTQNYIKTTASLEHGNSGGGAYNEDGQFIGIPTMVIAGELNSIGYILSINSVKLWLSDIFGSQYQGEVPKQEFEIEKSNINIQNDITPPNIDNISVEIWKYVDGNSVYPGEWWYGAKNLSTPTFYWYGISDNVNLKGYYVYFGKDVNANPQILGSYIDEGYEITRFQGRYDAQTKDPGQYYLIIQAIDINNNFSEKYIYDYLYDPNVDSTYGVEFNVYADKKKTGLLGNFNRNPFLFSTDDEITFEWSDVSPSGYYITVSVYKNYVAGAKEWGDIIVDEQFLEDSSYTFDIPEKGVKYNIGLQTKKNASNIDGTGLCSVVNVPSKKTTEYVYSRDILFRNGKEGIISNDKYNYLIKEFNLYLKENLSINRYNSLTSNEINYYEDKYIYGLYPIEDILIAILYDKKIINYSDWTNAVAEINLDSYNYIKNKYKNNINIKDIDLGMVYGYDKNFQDNIKGKIIIQIESRGQAFYIYPDNLKKYYLGRPEDAFNVMRSLGLGVTHNFISNHTMFPDNVSGKILLDVEQNGEAYYIYPKDKKAYYLGRPADAFRIMRELGLGITNSDLSKIPKGDL